MPAFNVALYLGKFSLEFAVKFCLMKNYFLHDTEIPAGFGAGSTSPSNAHVLIGGIAEISCNPTGSPKPTIRWRKLSEESDDIEVVSQGRFTILPNGNLRIKRVVATDEGKYQCIVRNSLNSASKSAELFVRGMCFTVFFSI